MAKGDVIIKTFTVTGTSGSYVTGDVIGAEISVSGCVSATGGSARIFHVSATDDSDVMGACDLMFAVSTASPAADSTAFAPSDANNKLYKGTIELPGWVDVGGARRIEWNGVVGVYSTTTTLFLTTVARATIGTLAASALVIDVWLMQDQ